MLSDELCFITRKREKFEEAKRILAEQGISLCMLEADLTEVQSDRLEDIAKASAREGAVRFGVPVVVEDAGLFIKALGGFPGPYSAFVFRTIGNKGILKLMKNVRNREAEFRSAVAFCRPEEEVVCFLGVVRGRIAEQMRGRFGFGYDPIFIPEEGDGRTFGEMTMEEKNALSHRGRAFRRFAAWFKSACRQSG